MTGALSKHLFLDVNVLFSPVAFDVFLTLAEHGSVEVMWSQAVVDEALRAIGHRNPQVVVAAERRFAIAAEFFRSALVEGWEARLEDVGQLPDPDDRHVVAAAIEGGCDAIVTFNLRDFPAQDVQAHGLVAVSPDDYLATLAARDAATIRRAMAELEAAKRNPPRTHEEERALLVRSGLVRFAETLAR